MLNLRTWTWMIQDNKKKRELNEGFAIKNSMCLVAKGCTDIHMIRLQATFDHLKKYYKIAVFSKKNILFYNRIQQHHQIE